MNKINIGIDIGGRHVGMSLVDEKGKIFEKEIINYQDDKSDKYILSQITKYIKNHEEKANCVGIGVPRHN